MNTMMNPNKYFLIVALDFNNTETAIEFVKKVPEVQFFKIGMELFYSEGPSIIQKIKDLNENIKIFLDLKINDIPKTIEKAVASVSTYGPDYLTTFCNAEGVRAAREGSGKSSTKILNVTVLTSENTDYNMVRERAVLSFNSGAHGIICSGRETGKIRQEIQDQDFIIVNPGVRLFHAPDDQVRTVTPRQALEAGASNIVVGRPITLAEHPEMVVDEYLKSLHIPEAGPKLK